MRKQNMENAVEMLNPSVHETKTQTSSPKTRADIVSHVRKISPWLDPKDTHVSNFIGSRAEAEKRIQSINPSLYGRTRNHLEGAVTQLSPYISRGVVSSEKVCDAALSKETPKEAEKFIQQVAWREYWQGILEHNPQWLWHDAENYKTGLVAADYIDELPEDIVRAQTGTASIDHFLTQLMTNGWVHNHARLYLASYICHWRHVKWQVGAKFFLKHLLDADLASNNLSWQWVASTFSHKPYYFNLENVQKFSGPDIDTSPENNVDIDASYEVLAKRLFPNLEPK
jgi:deoxyribodipyrimidine photo-lyase